MKGAEKCHPIGGRLRTGPRGHPRVAADERYDIAVHAGNGRTHIGTAEVEAEVERAQTLGSRPATSVAFSAEASLPKT